MGSDSYLEELGALSLIVGERIDMKYRFAGVSDIGEADSSEERRASIPPRGSAGRHTTWFKAVHFWISLTA